MNFNISNLASLVFSVNKINAIKQVQQNQEYKPSPTNSEFLANMNPKQVQNLYTQITHATANVMNNVQQNMFLRDMLGLPKDWTILLNQFVINNNNAQIANMLNNLNSSQTNALNSSLLALLQANARVDLQALAKHLQENSNLMADKLLKYMGNSTMDQNNIAQLKNIMLIGASIAGSVQINPQEFMRDIIQMYLPWLPLVPPQDKDLSEIEATMTGDSNKNSQALFYISTSTLGYFKVEIIIEDNIEIFITNVCEKENEQIKDELIKLLHENIDKLSTKAQIFYSKKIDNKELHLKEKQIYIVNSTDSLIGLTLLQLIPRVIFEFDEKQGQRIQKLED